MKKDLFLSFKYKPLTPPDNTWIMQRLTILLSYCFTLNCKYYMMLGARLTGHIIPDIDVFVGVLNRVETKV